MRRIEIKSPETKGKPLLFHCVRSRNDKELTGEIGSREKEKAGQRENKFSPGSLLFNAYEQPVLSIQKHSTEAPGSHRTSAVQRWGMNTK